MNCPLYNLLFYFVLCKMSLHIFTYFPLFSRIVLFVFFQVSTMLFPHNIMVQSIFHAISSSGSKRMKPFPPKIKATKWAKSFPSDDPHPVCTYRKMLKGSTIHWFGEGQFLLVICQNNKQKNDYFPK